MLKVDEAKKELKAKSYISIQEETAWRWASRAAAAFSIAISEDLPYKHLMYSMGNSYFGEATEHASEVSAELVQEIKNAVNPYEEKSSRHIQDILIGVKNV